MQSLVPDLTTPLDEFAACTVWYRLSPETLADILPYCNDARHNGKYRSYTVPHEKLASLILEQAVLRQDKAPFNKILLHMLTGPAALYVSTENMIKAGNEHYRVELCFEFGKSNPDGLLVITGGNRNLVDPDARVS